MATLGDAENADVLGESTKKLAYPNPDFHAFVGEKAHCFKLTVFRCLSKIAMENIDTSKGRTAIQDNS